MKIKIKSVLLAIILAVVSNLINAQDEPQKDPQSQEQIVPPVNTENAGENKNTEAAVEQTIVPEIAENKEQNNTVQEDKKAEPAPIIEEDLKEQKVLDNPTSDAPEKSLEDNAANNSNQGDLMTAVEQKNETEKPVVIKSIEDTLLFRFIQDFAFLEAAAKSIKVSETIEGSEITIIKTNEALSYLANVNELPFSDLNKKLCAKLINLAEKEALSIVVDKKGMDETNCWDSFLKTNPNLSDLFILFSDFSIKKRFCVDNTNIDFKTEIESIINSKGKLESEIDVLKSIFEATLSSYKEFLNTNSEMLQKIEQEFNNTLGAQCVKYGSRDFCTKNAKPVKLKSLRELIEYVQKS